MRYVIKIVHFAGNNSQNILGFVECAAPYVLDDKAFVKIDNLTGLLIDKVNFPYEGCDWSLVYVIDGNEFFDIETMFSYIRRQRLEVSGSI